MRFRRPNPASLACALAGGALLLTGLGGCTTHVKVQPSAAVLEMRSAAAQRSHAVAAACTDPRGLGAEATVIRFGFDDAEIDEISARRFGPILDWARCAPAERIVLAGEADKHGTPQAQQDLAARRIEVIRNYLVKAGVDGGRISVAASAKDVPPTDGGPLVLLGVGRGW